MSNHHEPATSGGWTAAGYDGLGIGGTQGVDVGLGPGLDVLGASGPAGRSGPGALEGSDISNGQSFIRHS